MNKPVKILIVDDSEDDAKLVLLALRGGGFAPTYRRVQTAAELETALTQEGWDAVISDFNMPGFTGMDALRIFRSTGLDSPFILISGAIGEETAVKAMKAGASDYVMKQSLALLAPALERELKETQMRAAHRQAQCELVQSEKRFRQMAENIRDAFFLIDAASNRVLYVSPAYEEIWGRSRESLYANPEAWTEAIYPDDRASTYEKYKKGMLAGKFEYEYRIVRPDGTIRWIEARGFPVRDDTEAGSGDGPVVDGDVWRELRARGVELEYRLSFPHAGASHSLVASETFLSYFDQLRASNGEVFVHFGDSDVISLVNGRDGSTRSVFDRFRQEVQRSRIGGQPSPLVRLAGAVGYSAAEIDGSRDGTDTGAEPSFDAKLTVLLAEAHQVWAQVLSDGRYPLAYFIESNTLLNTRHLGDLLDSLSQQTAETVGGFDFSYGLHRGLRRQGQAGSAISSFSSRRLG